MTALRCVIPVIVALLLAACVSSPGYQSHYNSQPRYSSPPPVACHECGTVVGIERAIARQSFIPGTGALLGGLVGAVVGKEVGRSFSGSHGKRNVAALAGALGGAMLGEAMQNQFEGGPQGHLVHVRMHDGRTVALHLADVAGLQQGMQVRLHDGRIYID